MIIKRLFFILITLSCYQLIVAKNLTSGEITYEHAKKAYEQDSLVRALSLGYEALTFAQFNDDYHLETKSQMLIFGIQYKSLNFRRAIGTARLAIEAAPDDTLRYRNHFNLALAYLQEKQLDSALYYFYSAYDYFVSVKDINRVCQNLNYIGQCYFYVPDYSKSRKYYFDLLDLAEEYNLRKYSGYALNNIGNSYLKEGKTDSALLFLEKALPFKNAKEKLTTYLNLAKLTQDNYDYLLLAKASYKDRFDNKDYIDILQQLREHHAGTDSAYYYASLIADFALENQNNKAAIDSYSLQLQIENVEHKREIAKLKALKDKQTKYWAAIVTLVIIVFIIAIIIMKAFFNKIPKKLQYKIDLLDYQKNELTDTLRQLMKKKTE